jgi:hypothetical protein
LQQFDLSAASVLPSGPVILASSVAALQSVVILTVLTAGVFVGLERPLLFWALVLWLGGGALYLWIITLIFFRYTFVHMAPEDLTPPCWINMGAVADLHPGWRHADRAPFTNGERRL